MERKPFLTKAFLMNEEKLRNMTKKALVIPKGTPIVCLTESDSPPTFNIIVNPKLSDEEAKEMVEKFLEELKTFGELKIE